MRSCSKLGISAVILLLPCTSAYPAELAILRNGFAISYEHRETRNTVTRLYLTENSNDYVDVPTGQILRFQVEDLDLPEIPSPRLSPRRHIAEVSTAANTPPTAPCLLALSIQH